MIPTPAAGEPIRARGSTRQAHHESTSREQDRRKQKDESPESHFATRGLVRIVRFREERIAEQLPSDCLRELTRRCPTLPHGPPCSTIGSEELNFRVRDGIGCGLLEIATGICRRMFPLRATDMKFGLRLISEEMLFAARGSSAAHELFDTFLRNRQSHTTD